MLKIFIIFEFILSLNYFFLEGINVFLNFFNVVLSFVLLGSFFVVWIFFKSFGWLWLNYVFILDLKCSILWIGILFRYLWISV